MTKTSYHVKGWACFGLIIMPLNVS
uniref:Uncharacterized protein n=1 Tax=Rhizophora mucronata TaxID=61149 RepID=A0A2P2PFP4_RHIMU